MPIEFRCTQCTKLLRTPDNTAGKQAKCPQCGAIVTIPAPPERTGSASRETSPFGPPPPPSPPPAENPFSAPQQPSYGFAPGEENPYQSPGAFAAAQSPFGAQRGFTPTVIDAGEVFSRAYAVFKAQVGMCILGVIVPGVLNFGVNMAFSMATMVPAAMMKDEVAVIMLNLVANLATTAFSIWIGIGQTIFFLKIARGEEATLNDLFAGSRWFWPVLGASILFGIMVFLGLVACIIPGIILMLMFGQFYYLIIDRNVPIMDAFSLSKEITTGNKLTLILLWLISVGIVLLGFLAFCVGLIIAIPLVTLMWPMAYLMMTGQGTAGQPLADPTLR